MGFGPLSATLRNGAGFRSAQDLGAGGASAPQIPGTTQRTTRSPRFQEWVVLAAEDHHRNRGFGHCGGGRGLVAVAASLATTGIAPSRTLRRDCPVARAGRLGSDATPTCS